MINRTIKTSQNVNLKLTISAILILLFSALSVFATNILTDTYTFVDTLNSTTINQNGNNVLDDGDINSTVQAYDADLADLADGTLSKSKVQDSTNWDNAYTWSNANHSNWDDAYDLVNPNYANWNNAYLWSNANHSNWDTAYGWGNHASYGYITVAVSTLQNYYLKSETYNKSEVYNKTEIDTQGEMETIWGVTLATDTELAGQDECSEITGCIEGAYNSEANLTTLLNDNYLSLLGGVVTGGMTIAGNVSVDTDVLHVDTSNDRVGIGTYSPKYKLEVQDGTLLLDTDTSDSSLIIESESLNDNIVDITKSQDSTSSGFKLQDNESEQRVYLLKGLADTEGMVHIYRDLPSTETNNAVMKIEQENAGDDQPALKIQNDGTGNSIEVDQNGDKTAIYVYKDFDSDKPTALFEDNGAGAGTNRVYLARGGDSDRATGYFYRNLASANTDSPMVFIEQDHSSDDQPALTIQQDGSGYGMRIETDNIGPAIIAYEGVNHKTQILNEYNDTDGSNYFYSNLDSGDTAGPLVKMVSDNAANDQYVLSLQQDGNKDALFINQNGVPGYGAIWIENRDNENSRGLFIHNPNGYSSSQYAAIRLTNWDGNYGSTDLWQGTNNTWGTNYFRRNVNSTYTNEAIIYGHQDNINDNQPVITTRQDSSSAPFMRLIQNGHTCNLRVDSDGTCDSGTAIVVDNGIAICAVCS